MSSEFEAIVRKPCGMLLSLVIVAAVAVSGCATQSLVTAREDASVIPQLPAYSGPKARIAIADFASLGTGQSAAFITRDGSRWTIAEQQEEFGGLKAMLTSALMGSDRFQVLETSTEPMKEEIRQGEEGYMREESRVHKGGWEGADLMVYAEITKWEPDAGGSSAGVGGLLPNALGGLKVGKKKSIVGLNIRIVDPRSRITLASKPVEAVATSWNMGLGGGTWGAAGLLVGGLSKYEKTPMGTAIGSAIAKAVELVATATPGQYFKYN